MGVDIAWPPTFSLVYATPLLQHQARFGLNPALAVRGKCLKMAFDVGVRLMSGATAACIRSVAEAG